MFNISKIVFQDLVVAKLNFKRDVVIDIINILFDELRKDVYEKNKIVKIKNFCIFCLRENKPKLHFSIVHKKVMLCKPKKQFRFNIYPAIKNILYEYIDKDSFK